MKKITLILGVFIFFQSHGQLLKKIGDKAKQKIENKADKSADDAVNGKKDENKVNEVKDTPTTPETNNNQPASLKVYSKYDFVPGEKILVFEDFMQDAVGDFPAKWNTNAAGEIVTVGGKSGHWFSMGKNGCLHA